MKNSYLTLTGKSTGLYKDRGSKFYSFAFPVSTTDEIKNHLDELRKEYHDARHHCYAYVLGAAGKEERTNDDGEPNHSAGDSILRSIKSRDLTNTLVVVVRYFGGTKLGIRGLIDAYYGATEVCLNNAKIDEVEIVKRVVIKFSYSNTGEVMRLVEKFSGRIDNQSFGDECELRCLIRVDKIERFEIQLKEMLAQKIIVSFDITPVD